MHSLLSPVYFTKTIWTDSRLWLWNPPSICYKCLNMSVQETKNRKRPLDFEKSAAKQGIIFYFPTWKSHRTVTVTFPNYVLSLQSIAHLDVWRKARPFYWFFFQVFFAGVHSSRLMLWPSHSFAPLPLFITFTRNISSLMSSTQDSE